MNKVIQYSFSQWLAEQEQVDEAVRHRMRPEDLGRIDQNKQLLAPNDLVELTKSDRKKIPEYGQVVNVTGQKVLVRPLAGGKPVMLSLNDLHEVPPEEMPMAHRQQLSTLGAARLWKKRSERQASIEQRKREKEAAAQAANQPYQAPEISKFDINRIKGILAGGNDVGGSAAVVDDDPLKSLFSPQSEPKPKIPPRPALARFVNKDQSNLGALGARMASMR